MRRVTVLAPAKVNLLLSVGALRGDGFHEVTTVMASLALADTLTIEPASELELTREPEPGFPAREDLTWRAAEAIAAAFGRDPGLRIGLGKRIPVAAGLGGGSSDAAAVLLGACRLWGLDPASGLVTEVARELGADVAFFLVGGVALLDGRGDRLVRALAAPPVDIVLVNPGVDSPTASVYREFDADPEPRPDTLPALEKALSAGDTTGLAAAVANNLGPAALRVAPAAVEALALLGDAPGMVGAWVSGSGSTVFAIAADARAASEAARAATDRGWWACATHVIGAGARAV